MRGQFRKVEFILQDRIQRVDSLGWFRDAALRDTLTTRLSAAYAAYKRRDYWEAYQHLSAAMARLQQGRGSQIDDRGFFVRKKSERLRV